MKWLEEKRVQVEHVEKLMDKFVQVFISPQVPAIVYSNYYQVTLASIFICTLSKSQVSEALHVAKFPLHTQRQLHYYLWGIKEREANFIVANSTAFAWCLARLGDTRLV